MSRSLVLRWSASLAVASLAGALAPVHAGGEPRMLLPDIVVRRSDLFDHDLRTIGGRLHLRLSNGTANVGVGPLYLYGVTPGNADGTQDVRQRIFHEDGSTTERVAGRFVFHAGHNHIHVEDWAAYRLRRVVGTDGVGDAIAEGEKTSFCILDLAVFDRTLPNFQPGGQFRDCSSTIQGLSVGWIDIYSKTLPGQSIDVTDVPDGHYWLESEVDPNNDMLESDEENNITRIRITLGNPSAISPDAYEANNSIDTVRALSVGSPNSSNLGPTNPKWTQSGLTIHESGDDDYFRFYANHTGTADDFVRADFTHAEGDIEIQLLTDGGSVVASSRTSSDIERISLEGVPEGWYFARVFAANGGTSPAYQLTINPPANEPPAIETVAPPAGNISLRHGLDLYEVRWQSADPEADETWVSVFVNTVPVLDENAELVPTTLHTPGDLGSAVLNTAEVEPGTYYVYCQITDGGSIAGDWSEGTLALVDLGEECIDLEGTADCNQNGVLDSCDLAFGTSEDCNENGVLDECDIAAGDSSDAGGDGIPDECGGARARFHRGDVNGDGRLDISDSSRVLLFLFAGGEAPGCLETADVDNDREVNVTDAIAGLNYLFLGGPAPAAPGPPGTGCGEDPDAPGSAGDIGCAAYTGC